MIRTITATALLCISLALGAQTAETRGNGDRITVSVHDSAPGPVIPKEIYGQFSEHLGRCIYDGIWVGPDSVMPNENGYRSDVLEALRELHVPVLRWPGGCFADEYHWRDGIGPRSERPKMINSNWGGTLEDNSFGTHEFLDLCEMLGTEPYISGNVGSGTVGELAQWVEYMTAREGTMAELRRSNGRVEPWKVKYLGVGNESWGCGGNMTPEYYSDLYRRYATYCRDFDGNCLYKVASGASDYDYNWTKVLMNSSSRFMDGLSLHYYTVVDWNSKGSATDFSDGEYYDIVAKCAEIDEVLRNHESIMDAFDPSCRVGLLLDEWGTWFEVEPGTEPGHLYQQNTMRDAIVAALSLNIFNGHTRRLKMANIAQIVNVLQSMILTEGDRMLLTPTYHVFRMFRGHQDAVSIPVEYSSLTLSAPSGRSLPSLSVSCSRASDGSYLLTLANPSLDSPAPLSLVFDEFCPRTADVEILSSGNIRDCNSFDSPAKVRPTKFNGVSLAGSKGKKGSKLAAGGFVSVTLTVPPASVVSLTLR